MRARRGTRLRHGAAVIVSALALALGGCSPADVDVDDAPDEHGAEAAHPSPDAHEGHGGHDGHGGHGGSAASTRAARVPLRPGERRLSVAMPEPYRPAAPAGGGTDDYRCFLLDPGLTEDAVVTGTQVSPGTAETVHHVVLFQVPPQQVEAARAHDRETPGQGWTCFGGSGLDAGGMGGTTPWLGAWTPGSGEDVLHEGYGVPLASGTQLVMQVHYNLAAGDSPDTTAAELRLAGGGAELEPVSTLLLPAPVELPCRPDRADGPLCDRDAALQDLRQRFGTAGSMADWLQSRCPGGVPGPRQSCTTTVPEPTTIIGVAGHMHLLGRAIRIEVNPGTSRARTILDVAAWNFDDQGAVPIEPVRLASEDRIRVTCEHDQSLRDHLPAFEGQPDRYVLWGEGTTDEMCAGILQVAP